MEGLNYIDEQVDNYVITNLTTDNTHGMVMLMKSDLVEYFGYTKLVAENTVDELIIKYKLD